MVHRGFFQVARRARPRRADARSEGARVLRLRTRDTRRGAIPTVARRGRPDQREGPRRVLPEAPPGDAGLSLGSSVRHDAGARPPRPRRAGCDWVLVGIPGVVAHSPLAPASSASPEPASSERIGDATSHCPRLPAPLICILPTRLPAHPPLAGRWSGCTRAAARHDIPVLIPPEAASEITSSCSTSTLRQRR